MQTRTKLISNRILCITLAFLLSLFSLPLILNSLNLSENPIQSVHANTSSNEIIVVYEEGISSLADCSNCESIIHKACSIESEDSITDSLAGTGKAELLTVDHNEDLAIDILNDSPDVAFAQKNFHYQLMETDSYTVPAAATTSSNDPYIHQQYYLGEWDSTFNKRCGANVINAWNMMEDSDSVTIAILDTGCQYNHEDLYDNILHNLAYNVSTEETGSSAVNDLHGHGTHVAGIAAAVSNNGKGISGVSGSAVKILPINIFEDADTDTKRIISAYSYLENLMNSGQLDNLHVINLSLGGYEYNEHDEALFRWIDYMRTKNVLTVCAGGNGDNYESANRDLPIYPGDYKGSLCVTSLNRFGSNSSFSDYNMDKDISAPGEGILSTVSSTDITGNREYVSGNSSYGYKRGTSMATALVSGIAALLWADNSSLTVDQVVNSITSTAHPVNPGENDRTNQIGSAGAIDAAAALEYSRSMYSYSDSSNGDNTAMVGPKPVDISKVDISSAKITLSSTRYIANGENHTPTIKLSISNKTLKPGRDYTVKFSSNRKSVGLKYITITGQGDYTGSVKRTYQIVPKSTSISKLKSYKKALTIKWRTQRSDTSGYQIRYSTHPNMKNAKYVKISSNKSKSKKIKKLKYGKIYYVQIRTYKKVGNRTFYSNWSKKKSVRIK